MLSRCSACLFFRGLGNTVGLFWRRGSESNRRIKVLQTSPLPLGYRAPAEYVSVATEKSPSAGKDFVNKFGAGDGGRTRDIDLGKVALYH